MSNFSSWQDGLCAQPIEAVADKTYNVLIASSDAFTRVGIRVALETEDSFTVVAEAATGLKLLPLAGRTNPDVVLLDLDLADVDGITCLERLQRRFPETAVIMLVPSGAGQAVSLALARGAQGVVMKSVDPADLGRVLDDALSGEPFMPAEANLLPTDTGLSGRELEIVQRVGRGLTNKQIALELGVTLQTVKFHLTNVYRKLGLENRTATARWAHETGLLNDRRR
jgi:DNA-binding NarL/FixJ family response regulator